MNEEGKISVGVVEASWRRGTGGHSRRTGRVQTSRGKEESFSGASVTEIRFAC